MSNLKTFSSKRFSNKNAFSLIELSIVLIIIGLLIAGVTGGTSLIKSAELRSLMNEARGYNVAVNTFYTQFDELPGDFGTAIDGGGADSSGSNTGVAQAGDENGAIEYINSSDIVEGVSAWQQLSATSIIDDTLAYTALADLAASTGTAAVCGVELPESKIKDGCWIFDFRSTQNVVIVTAGVGAGTTDDPLLNADLNGVITPSDAFSIDLKMDDGNSGTGDVRDPFVAILTATAQACSANTSGSSSGLYTTGTITKACTLSFDMDVL